MYLDIILTRSRKLNDSAHIQKNNNSKRYCYCYRILNKAVFFYDGDVVWIIEIAGYMSFAPYFQITFLKNSLLYFFLKHCRGSFYPWTFRSCHTILYIYNKITVITLFPIDHETFTMVYYSHHRIRLRNVKRQYFEFCKFWVFQFVKIYN